METPKVICDEDKSNSLSSITISLLLKLSSWNGMYEHVTHNNRHAVMKATTFGIFHLVWILFNCSGGFILVKLFPSFYDYMYTLIYLLTVHNLISITQYEQTHAVYMCIAFWIAGISFAPTQDPILSLCANVMYAVFHTNDFLRVTSLLFFIYKIWSRPRVMWDTNPCSLLYAILVLFGLSTTFAYFTFKFIPPLIIPYFIFPFVQIPDQFSDTATHLIIQVFNSGTLIFLIYIIGELYNDTVHPHTLWAIRLLLRHIVWWLNCRLIPFPC